VDTAAFDYELPSGRIAQEPVEPRDAARLLVDHGPGQPVVHAHIRDLPRLLDPGDLVVVNDSRVLPARLHLHKPTGGAVEVLLLEPAPEHGPGAWEALVRPSRRVPPGTVCTPARAGVDPAVTVEVLDDLGDGRRVVRVHHAGDGRTGELAAIEAMGEMPLPPYITTPLGEPERYQTVYSARVGSAAAPTAGLHLTDAVLAGLAERGVGFARVELVVGLDTFRPITTDRVEDHTMHSEAYVVPEATWAQVQATRAAGGRVVAVGTTAMRALESAAARGELAGRTDLFVHGSYPFAVVDRLLTNFHLPRSSLLVLIDAFVGPRWRVLYRAAAEAEYRFLSFGDAMLLTRSARSDEPRSDEPPEGPDA
jgi:S-adenosylmethionine:tRNA ribosyltransferase-isomerase